VLVDADHHLALAAAHEVSYALVLFKREVHAITRGLTERTLNAMKATQQASRAKLQAIGLDGLAKRIHTQLRETPASTASAEVAA
jgi:hypothetical protein